MNAYTPLNQPLLPCRHDVYKLLNPVCSDVLGKQTH
jgi:hypothetical protein